MKRNAQVLLFVLAPFVAAVPSLHATSLLGVQEGNPNLVFVDSLTGNISPAFPVPGGIVPTRIVGLTRAENGLTVLFVREDTDATSTLFRLDSRTGAVLSTHPLTTMSGQPAGLSYDTSNGSTYVVDDGQFIGRQKGFGGAYETFVDPTPGRDIEFPGALGGDDFGRHFAVFWPGLDGASSATIGEFDPVDGTILNFFRVPQVEYGVISPSGLAFDGQSIFVSYLEVNELLTLDPDTGAVTHSVRYGGQNLHALAVAAPADPVPEASSVAMWSVLCALALSSSFAKGMLRGSTRPH